MKELWVIVLDKQVLSAGVRQLKALLQKERDQLQDLRSGQVVLKVVLILEEELKLRVHIILELL